MALTSPLTSVLVPPPPPPIGVGELGLSESHQQTVMTTPASIASADTRVNSPSESDRLCPRLFDTVTPRGATSRQQPPYHADVH